MSAWPARDDAFAREAEVTAQDDAWRASRLRLVREIIADRALGPAAQHALIELLLDPVDDAVVAAEDERLPWSARLARRLCLTPRGARMALAELAGLGLVEREGAAVRVLPDSIAERMCRGTDAPLLPDDEGLDPAEAHALRLERLRDFALGQGLVATALATQRAIGRALGLDERPNAAPAEAVAADSAPIVAAAAPETPEPPAQPPRLDVLPFIRRLLDIDPAMGPVMRDVLAEIRSGPSPAMQDELGRTWRGDRALRDGCPAASSG